MLEWALIFIDALFCLWVIFLGGAEKIEGSWLAALELHATADARALRFMAWLNLLVLVVVLVVW